MKTTRPRHLGLAVALALALVAPWAAGGDTAEDDGLAGRWAGTILFEEGRVELDMTARFQHHDETGWSAVLDLPLVGVEDLQVDDVQFADGRLAMTFDLGANGGERRITAELADGADEMTGEFHQGAMVKRVLLERAGVAVAAEPVEVTTLAAGTGELKQRFLEDQGNVRLLVLLSPG